MAWNLTLADHLSSYLRFTIRATLLIGVIAVAVATAYVVVKLSYFTATYLDATLFSAPWGT